MATPWNPAEMTLDEARNEYERIRRIAKPSTVDLRREAAICRRIRELANDAYVEDVRGALARRELAVAGIGR